MVKFEFANILTAFGSRNVIGSKVIEPDQFIAVLRKAVEEHDFTSDRIPGQGYVDLGDSVNDFVSAGVGPRFHDPKAYVLREHRGRVSAYLHRDWAEKTSGCAVIVYTTDAYLADPDCTDEEHCRIMDSGCTHVIVAVLAFAGGPSQLSPYRLVHNLAGGNKEAQVWSADEIRQKARDVLEYDKKWAAVADPLMEED